MNQPIKIHELTPSESAHIRSLALAVIDKQVSLDELDFAANAELVSHKAPDSLQRVLHDFKTREADVAVHVKGLPITDQDVGPTPEVHRRAGDRQIRYGEVVHGILAPLLGDCFGFDSQQNGSLFNSIVAFRSQEHLSNTSMSAVNDFGFHTEDAFHPYPADYVSLMCFRNQERAATGISSLRGVDIPNAHYRVLSEPGRLWSRPNPGHVGAPPARNQQVIWGDRAQPYLRVNIPNIAFEDGDKEAQAALEFVKAALTANRTPVTLAQGEWIIIDNAQAVHSRDKFDPIYGAGARWLSRLVITRDLRKSRSLRAAPESRVMLNAA